MKVFKNKKTIKYFVWETITTSQDTERIIKTENKNSCIIRVIFLSLV